MQNLPEPWPTSSNGLFYRLIVKAIPRDTQITLYMIKNSSTSSHLDSWNQWIKKKIINSNHISQAVVLTDLQVELVAGVASIELWAGEAEPSLCELSGLPVIVAHLSDHLFIVGHGVHPCGKMQQSVVVVVTCRKRQVESWRIETTFRHGSFK